MPPNSGVYLDNATERLQGEYVTKDSYEIMRPKNEPQYLRKIREIEKKIGFLTPLKYINLTILLLYHLVTVWWLVYNLYSGLYPKWQTVLFGALYMFAGRFGVTAGVHRYWSHRSYKATTPFRWLLSMLFSAAGQDKLYEWVHEHRVHHKYSDTTADPHDIKRGFFYSHMGWIMMMKHPDVLRKARKIDMSDMLNDPVVQFNSKYFLELKMLLCYVVPMAVPVLAWAESWDQAIFAQLLFVLISSHSVYSVNSFAHAFGNKPYDPKIKSAENKLVSILTIGEGWHNYHHTFPWDYKAAELPYTINLTTLLLDCFALLGLVSDRKTASPELIKATVLRKHKSGSMVKQENKIAYPK